jgi:Cdc6-like AAA superfamily ATPase
MCASLSENESIELCDFICNFKNHRIKAETKTKESAKMKTLNLHQRSAEDLLNILHRLIYYGENNSALVIGPRGSGKTFLVKQVLENLRQELREKNCSDDLIIVYLSGLRNQNDFD